MTAISDFGPSSAHDEEAASTIETTAKCPACANSLQRLLVRGGLVSGCPACGGAWLDTDACNIVAHGGVFAATRAFVRSLDEAGPPQARTVFRDVARPTPEQRLCPVCFDALEPGYLREPNVTVDSCTAHGTFFDRGELARVIETVEIRAAALPVPGADVPALRPSRLPGRNILRVGAALFALSMVLPGVRDGAQSIPGALCALLGFVALEMPTVFLPALANVAVVFAPLYSHRVSANGAIALSLGAFSAGLLALSCAFSDAVHGLVIGFWVWVLSFFFIGTGFAVRAFGSSSTRAAAAA